MGWLGAAVLASTAGGNRVKKLGFAVLAVLLLLAAVAGGLYLTNTAPAVQAISAAEIAVSDKPYVIKMHAQWCPKCMTQRGVWSEIADTYADRVHLVVFDFTDDETTAASRAEAARLGLNAFFDEYAGATGFVVVMNRDKQVTGEVGGRQFDVYRQYVDDALKAS